MKSIEISKEKKLTSDSIPQHLGCHLALHPVSELAWGQYWSYWVDGTEVSVDRELAGIRAEHPATTHQSSPWKPKQPRGISALNDNRMSKITQEERGLVV
jgi:hypothetical protein